MIPYRPTCIREIREFDNCTSCSTQLSYAVSPLPAPSPPFTCIPNFDENGAQGIISRYLVYMYNVGAGCYHSHARMCNCLECLREVSCNAMVVKMLVLDNNPIPQGVLTAAWSGRLRIFFHNKLHNTNSGSSINIDPSGVFTGHDSDLLYH